MRRGEIWWVEFDERRPVVLLSEDEPSGFRAMQVVAPADTDISGWGIEVAVGVPEGLPFEGVLRFAFPWPGFTPCTWLTTLSRDDLIERAGAVSTAKLSEIDDALHASEQRTEWTPAAAVRLSEIKPNLRPVGLAHPALTCGDLPVGGRLDSEMYSVRYDNPGQIVRYLSHETQVREHASR